MNKLIYCKCGCQQQFDKFDNHHRIRRYILGHNPKNWNSKPRTIKLSVAMKERMSNIAFKLKTIAGIKKANTGLSGKNSRHWIYGGVDYGKKLIYANKERRCEECGGTLNLNVHHIDKDRRNNELDNLEILCMRCHKLTHKIYG